MKSLIHPNKKKKIEKGMNYKPIKLAKNVELLCKTVAKRKHYWGLPPCINILHIRRQGISFALLEENVIKIL
jgi:hypothetical protein